MSWTMNESHKWVMSPHTKYERFTELRVRESRQTFMTHHKRYLDIDTGKYNIDKINTISSLSLGDVIEDNDFGYGTRRKSYWENKPSVSYIDDGENRIVIPPFVPKPDDFEEDERREQIEKALVLIERKKQQIAECEIKIEAARKESEYAAYVTKRERELFEARKADEQRKSQIICNVITNRIRNR